MTRAPFDLSFFRKLRFVQVLLEFAALDPLQLPPFAGSAIRGALGHAFRPNLCPKLPPCPSDCAEPNTCPYFGLFERSRAVGRDGGLNIPKPLILEPPTPPELESISLGGPVEFPYEEASAPTGSRLRALRNDHPILIVAGATFGVRLTIFGQLAAILPAVVDLLNSSSLHSGKGRFALRRVIDLSGAGRLLYDARFPNLPFQPPHEQTLGRCLDEAPDPRCSRLRICFTTPTRLKLGDTYCFDREKLAAHFFQGALVRAMRVYETFCGPPGSRLPWMELPPAAIRLIRSRLFYYLLPRLSTRQARWMEFDGLVGHIEIEADLPRLLPLARSAEILHFGQKATFGLGKVRTFLV